MSRPRKTGPDGRVLAPYEVRKARRRLAAEAGVPWNPADDYDDETPRPINADAWGLGLVGASAPEDIDREIAERERERIARIRRAG